MTNGWTPERRTRAAALIARSKPWTRATGPRTAPGKQASAGNARKHGGRSRVFLAEMKRIRNYIRICRLTEQVIRHGLRNGGISTDALLVCQRLSNESFEILCAGQTEQIISGHPQENSRISTNELMAGEESAKESLEICEAPPRRNPSALYPVAVGNFPGTFPNAAADGNICGLIATGTAPAMSRIAPMPVQSNSLRSSPSMETTAYSSLRSSRHGMRPRRHLAHNFYRMVPAKDSLWRRRYTFGWVDDDLVKLIAA